MTRDITGDIGPLHERGTAPTVPMYSFDRPAYVLWQAVFDGLLQRGWSEASALAWLQSKGPRHMFDGDATNWVRFVGARIALTADSRYID